MALPQKKLDPPTNQTNFEAEAMLAANKNNSTRQAGKAIVQNNQATPGPFGVVQNGAKQDIPESNPSIGTNISEALNFDKILYPSNDNNNSQNQDTNAGTQENSLPEFRTKNKEMLAPYIDPEEALKAQILAEVEKRNLEDASFLEDLNQTSNKKLEEFFKKLNETGKYKLVSSRQSRDLWSLLNEGSFSVDWSPRYWIVGIFGFMGVFNLYFFTTSLSIFLIGLVTSGLLRIADVLVITSLVTIPLTLGSYGLAAVGGVFSVLNIFVNIFGVLTLHFLESNLALNGSGFHKIMHPYRNKGIFGGTKGTMETIFWVVRGFFRVIPLFGLALIAIEILYAFKQNSQEIRSFRKIYLETKTLSR